MSLPVINPTDVLCIYHGNCADGFTAAWVVRRYFGHKATFHAGHYGSAPPDVTGKHVYIVDFSYARDALIDMASKALSITVLDHHKTAREALSDLPENSHIHAVFDMDRSGARITWDHFFPEQMPPRVLLHVEDRDLWRFALDGTRAIQSAVFSYPYDFSIWNTLMENDPVLIDDLIIQGNAIERKHHKDVDELIKVCQRRMLIGGHDVPAASLPYTLTSDAGHVMAQGEPFAACYWDTVHSRSFSLRSTDEGMDVALIAQEYGGGGHRNASGFRVPRDHPLAIC